MGDASYFLNYGVALFCLVALGWGIKHVAVWVANNVIKPITAAHIQTLDALTRTAQEQQVTQARQTDILANIEERLDGLQEEVRQYRNPRDPFSTQVSTQEAT